MEAASQPVTQPLSDVDRKILSIMDKLGWGVTASKLAEYADIDPGDVLSSLTWMAQQGIVESSKSEMYGWVSWQRKGHAQDHDPSTVCPACGERFKNSHGLAIHRSKAHHYQVDPRTVWISESTEEDAEKFDYMSMDVEPRTMEFIQDVLRRFAELPGVKIRVTVEFKGAGA